MTDPLDLELALLPERVGPFLAHSAAHLVAAQLVTGAAVQPLRGFLSGPGADYDDQWQVLASPRYLADLGLEQDPAADTELAAALTWYVQNDVLDDAELATLAAVAAARSDLAAALLETTHPASLTMLTAAAGALAKIERFWARTNASINGDTTDYDDSDIGTAQADVLAIVVDSATRVTVTPTRR